MVEALGPLAAFGAAAAWAYASTRYAAASREVAPVRVNLGRALTALPIYAGVHLAVSGPRFSPELTPARAAWLLASVVSSYAVADSGFFAAARRIGVTTALCIASTYPLWATLWGTLAAGQPLGPARSVGTTLAVAGVVWLVRLSGGGAGEAAAPRDPLGLALAFATSLLWAANSVAVKEGSTGLLVAEANALRYAMALVILAPQVALLPAVRRGPTRPKRGWGSLVPAFLVDTVIGSSGYVYGLSHTDLAVGATLSSLAPLIAAPVAVVLGEEPWSARRFAAVVTTVAGVVLLVR